MMNIKTIGKLILNFFILLFFMWLAYTAFYDLFIFELNVHTPKFYLTKNSLGKIFIEYTLDTATVALLSTLVGIYASLKIFAIKIFDLIASSKKYWHLQGVCLFLCIITNVIYFLDFFSSPFIGQR